MRNGIKKYSVIQGILRSRLAREATPGEKIATEAVLCEEFSASRATVQRALQGLERLGIIKREQGVGTFYLGEPTRRMEQKPSQLLESLMDRRSGAETRLVQRCTRRPPPVVAELLGIPVESTIHYLERLCLVDGEPIAFIRTYLPQELGDKILADGGDRKRLSLAGFIADEYGIFIDSVRQTISASVAEPDFADLLGAELGDPVLEGRRIYLDKDGTPLFCAISSYRADRHTFIVNVKDWRDDVLDSDPTQDSIV